MSANWEQYFDCKNRYYEYKDKNITTLPANLPMPPTDTLECMFGNCHQLSDISALANWDVSNVKNVRWMFQNCHKLGDITALANWDVSNVKDMSGMFYGCEQLKDITAFANWNVSSVENMNSMFSNCDNLKDINALANWNVSNVQSMSGMFYGCKQLQDATPLANWNVSRVNNMSIMFRYCRQLHNISALANWNVSGVWNMSGMFLDCDFDSTDTNEVKAYLREFNKRSYPKQDHTSLLKSLWERVKPLLKHTTKLNNHFKGYKIEAPVKEPVNVAKPDALLIDELKAIIQQQQQTIDELQKKMADLTVFQWNP